MRGCAILLSEDYVELWRSIIFYHVQIHITDYLFSVKKNRPVTSVFVNVHHIHLKLCSSWSVFMLGGLEPQSNSYTYFKIHNM
jgi:hypothetical protein